MGRPAHRLAQIVQVGAQAFHQRRQVDLRGGFAAGAAGGGQHLLGQGLQFVQIAQQPVAQLVVLDEFQVDAHGGDGGAQIMAHRRQQMALAFQGPGDFGGHGVEGDGGIAHIVGAFFIRHAGCRRPTPPPRRRVVSSDSGRTTRRATRAAPRLATRMATTAATKISIGQGAGARTNTPLIMVFLSSGTMAWMASPTGPRYCGTRSARHARAIGACSCTEIRFWLGMLSGSMSARCLARVASSGVIGARGLGHRHLA